LPRSTSRPTDPAPFGRDALKRDTSRVLNEGRWANAVLYVIEHDAERWVVKDFGSRTWLVRNTIGRLLIGREFSALHRLQGIEGVPRQPFRLDAFALGYRFVAGATLARTTLEAPHAGFFCALERLMQQVHEVGLVHLDSRNSRNILVTENAQPALIDFQSHLGTRWMPRALRRWLEAYDMAGVYKHWARRSPDTIDESRLLHLGEMNRWRRFWFLRGYLGVRKSRPVK
jgi:RIO-like serine/threonine protein kinase